MLKKEYEIEEDDVTTWYHVTRKKDGKTFSAERTRSALSGITECTVYDTCDDEDEEIIPTNEEKKEIEDAIRNYLEQKEDPFDPEPNSRLFISQIESRDERIKVLTEANEKLAKEIADLTTRFEEVKSNG